MPSRRSLAVALALAVLVAVAAGAVLLVRPELASMLGFAPEQARLGRPPPAVETARVERVETEKTVTTTGTLVASESVVVTTEAAGRITGVRFTEGQPVESGQLLVELEREREEARLSEARARLIQRRHDARRQAQLRADGFVSEGELEAARAALAEAEAAVVLAREALEDRRIRAPFAGVTGRRLVSRGALVTPGAAITRLTASDHIDLLFEVPERRVAGLRPGLSVTATSPAHPGERFGGSLTFVGPELREATRTLPLEATLPNPDGRLRPGMFMQVELSMGGRTLLRVPEAAVLSRGPTHYVYRIARRSAEREREDASGEGTGRVERIGVETGLRRDGWVEIRSGLAAGDRVVTAGLGGLRDGTAVRLPPPGETDPDKAARRDAPAETAR